MEKILRNDLERAWARVKGLTSGTVDLVLDNGQSRHLILT